MPQEFVRRTVRRPTNTVIPATFYDEALSAFEGNVAETSSKKVDTIKRHLTPEERSRMHNPPKDATPCKGLDITDIL